MPKLHFLLVGLLSAIAFMPLPPVMAADPPATVNTGCCYKITFYTGAVFQGSCRWECQVNNESVYVSTEIICRFDELEFVQCRDPESLTPCGAPPEVVLGLGESLTHLDCDAFGQPVVLDMFCLAAPPYEELPHLNDCDEVPGYCEVPTGTQMTHYPSYQDCCERGCCCVYDV